MGQEVAGLIQTPIPIGSRTNEFQRNTSAIHLRFVIFKNFLSTSIPNFFDVFVSLP